jgi:hypothetical protein
MHPINKLQQQIEPLRQRIIHHEVYKTIRTLDDLRIFMQYHVYAVWDFMSLLKALQQELTCTTTPWFPKGNPDTRYLINEIVVGEESDVDENGQRISHFELYLQAMRQCGADTDSIEAFIRSLQHGHTLTEAYAHASTPIAAQDFVNFTFEVIGSQMPHLQAAVFTFGREDLIPGMFLTLVNDLNRTFPESISTFKYYLDRHIEVDGDHHSELALQMTAHLCANDADKWQTAQAFTVASLQKRIALWDGALAEITANHETTSTLELVSAV